MKRYPLLFIVAFFAILISCNSKRHAMSEVLRFDLSADPLPIFDILQEPIMIDLSSDSILMGEIEQVLSTDGHMFVLGENGGKNTISIFDRRNNALKQISRTGRGPLEYLGIQNIFLDKGRLGALDHTNGKIILFDFDGKVLNERKTPKMFMSLGATHDGYVGDMGNFSEDKKHNDNLWIMDSALVVRDSFFEIPTSWESRDLQHQSFSSYKEKTYYTRVMDNNIYTVEKEGIDVGYRLDFGDSNWPNPQAGYEQSADINRNNPGRYVSKFDRVQETDRHLIIQFLYNGQVCLGVYDKKSGQAVVRHLDVYTGKYFIPFGAIVGMDADAIYTTIDAVQIKRLWIGKDEYNDFAADYPEQIDRLRQEFPTVDEFGNPFLVIWKFK